MPRPADGPDERLVLPWWRRVPSELAGACGDLGTFIPHVIGAITVAGLAPAGVLIGFARCSSSREAILPPNGGCSFDSQPSCWPVIAVAAAVTLLTNPAMGLLCGFAAEMVRSMIVRTAVGRHRTKANPRVSSA